MRDRFVKGLPKNFVNDIFWVGDDHRTNDLSLQPGGSDVVVIYNDNRKLGYDKIKWPSKYIAAISRRNGDIEDIVLIYARTYHEDEYYENEFELAWEAGYSHEDPIEALEDYDLYRRRA